MISNPICIVRAALVLLTLQAVALGQIDHDSPSTTPADFEQPTDAAIGMRLQSFLGEFCVDCHGSAVHESELRLDEVATTAPILRDYDLWRLIRRRIANQEMPPADAVRRPNEAERREFTESIDLVHRREAVRRQGDPGIVLARRLNSAEFDYAIADLTHVDLRPAREFPVDPVNTAGFNNSGESLTMSPTLLGKYIAASQFVASHLVLSTNGVQFSPHPMVAETDRDKYCVLRIAAFYEKHAVDYADYFMSLCSASDTETSQRIGDQSPMLLNGRAAPALSERYRTLLATELKRETANLGPIALWQREMQQLIERTEGDPSSRLLQATTLRDLVLDLREQLVRPVEPIRVRGASPGSQPFVLYHNRMVATRRQAYAGDPVADYERLREVAIKYDRDFGRYFELDDTNVAQCDEARRELEQFCRIFPDKFFVAQRGPYFDPESADQQRLLTAGFHLMQGYFRDDGPLCALVLDPDEQAELDQLWLELDVICDIPRRQFQDFIFFERAEPPRFMIDAQFDFARSEDQDVTAADKLQRLMQLHLEKAQQNEASEIAIQSIQDYYHEMSHRLALAAEWRKKSEASHLEGLMNLAQRAWRRPLTADEKSQIVATYKGLRGDQSLPHDEAIRDTLATILASPKFCYHFVMSPDVNAPQGITRRPLEGYELADRLSTFLWSGLPDEELIDLASNGTLGEHDVLVAQTRRMLHDRRNMRFATEFLGQLLDMRRFQDHNSVDRGTFPQFDSTLRAAMYEEPLHFFVDCLQQNRSILDLVTANHTFVNHALASHYGLPADKTSGDTWTRVDDADNVGRGGILPMAVFLTQNSPGLRTSPVKRGYWVVRRLLGEYIPPPPPSVPELPTSEVALDRPLVEVLAQHRADQSCAGCHDRFDAIGLVFEGYGPIGERRDHDLADRLVDDGAMFPDGSQRKGVEGLKAYIVESRSDDLLDNIIRKLVVYGLGRSLIASDELLIDDIKQGLKSEKYPLGSVVERIVVSPQFRQARVAEE